MIQVKLNFQLNKPTINGRIYNEYILEKSLRKLFSEKKAIYILTDGSSVEKSIPSEKIAGFVRNYNIVGDNVILECDLVAKHKSVYQALVSQNMCFATPYAIGEIDNDGITILDDLVITHFFFTKEATRGVIDFDIHPKPDSNIC